MTIDTNEVLRIAALARLELDEGSVETFRHQMKEILDYVGMLGELDVTDVPPTTHPLGRGQAARPDELRPSLAVEEALANAPDAANDLFRVPRVIGG